MMNNDKNKLLLQIQATGFAAHEAALYLDGHPYNKKALDFYKKMKNQCEEATKKYSEKYGPISQNDINGNNWSWVETPWPWQTGSEV